MPTVVRNRRSSIRENKKPRSESPLRLRACVLGCYRIYSVQFILIGLFVGIQAVVHLIEESHEEDGKKK